MTFRKSFPLKQSFNRIKIDPFMVTFLNTIAFYCICHNVWTKILPGSSGSTKFTRNLVKSLPNSFQEFIWGTFRDFVNFLRKIGFLRSQRFIKSTLKCCFLQLSQKNFIEFKKFFLGSIRIREVHTTIFFHKDWLGIHQVLLSLLF